MTKPTPRFPERFGRLTVMARDESHSWSRPHLICLCDCGNTKVIAAFGLRKGSTQSCGCINAEFNRQRLQTHGMAGTPTYMAWTDMKRRCLDPTRANYPDYG